MPQESPPPPSCDETSKQQISRIARRKGVVSSGPCSTPTNSLDWDSPSTKTGTVKRRPVSGSGSSSSGTYKLSDCDCDSGIASPLSPVSFAGSGCFINSRVDSSSKSSKIRKQVSDIEPFVRCKSPECIDSKTEMANGNRFGWNKGARPKPAKGLNGNVLSGGADNGTRSEQERSRQNDASRYLNGNQIDYEPYTPGYSSYLPPCNSELDIREKEENRMKRGNLLSFAKDLKGGLNIFSSEKRQHANRSPEKSPEKRHSTAGILERKSNINGIGERRQLVNLKVKYVQERDVGSLRGAHDDSTQNTFPGHERKTCPGSLLSFKKDVGASSTKESYKSKRDRIADDTEDKPTGSLTNCSTETENGRSVRQTSFPASQEDDDGAAVFDRNCVWRCDGTERIVTDRSDDRGRSGGDGVGARSRSSSGECVRSYVNGACCCDRCCGRTGLDYDCKMKMLRDGFWRELEKVRKTVRVVDSGSFEKIYTDWANHYLEKARSKRRVAALATDCSDGVLLADVIESVTNTKIPDINRKPKTPGQMLDNINSCVNALRAQQVAGIEAISASELRDGRLKAVLALFFALSRHKQQTKQQQRLQQHGSSIEMAPHNTDTHVQAASPQHRQISAGVKNPTSIPLPGSALPARRCPPDKVRPAPPSQNNTSTVVHQQPSSVASSRASSPAASMIPRGPANSHPITQIPSSPYHSPSQQNGQNKSMLDKLKLFKNQDRNNVGTPTPPVTSGKRTSSSSGVSSAKSERSDSSASLEPLNEVTKPVNRNARTNKTTRTSNSRPVQTKNTTNSNKKENSFVSSANKNVVKNEIGYGNRSVSVSKLTEPKIKLTSNNKPSVTPPVTHNEKSTTNVNKNSGSHTEFNHAKQVPNNIISPLPTQPNSAQGTGIPKPTAAVKGTSKSVDEKNTSVVQPLKHSSSNHWNPVSRENSFAGTPTTTTTTTSPKPNQAVAMVSPMPSESQSSQLSESSHSGSHSASTGHHSNSSESSVIYKPSSESGSDHPASRSVIPNRKEPISFLNEEEELCNKSIDPETNGIDETNIKPVETQTNSETNLELGQKSSEESPLQLNSIPKPLPNGVAGLIPSHNRDGSLGDEETAPMNVEPMLPLVSVRGYCNNLTLPSRTGTRQQYIQRQVPVDGSDYCEIGLSNGYMSDGEVLRSHPDNGFRIGDMYDGYMSDGRSAIGLRRLQHNSSHQNIYQQQFMGQGAPRVSPSLAVLTEQSRPQRGGRVAAPDGGEPGDDAPPPTGPRPSKQTRHRVAADPSSHHNNNSAQWKKYTDSPGVGSPVIVSQQTHVSGHNASPSSPTSSRRERRGSPHGQNKEKSSSSKVRVPQSFGYVKRNSVGSNGTSMPVGVGGGAINQVSNSKTAQVSAVPRTKVKVSGGTQTCSSDLQPHQPSHHKSSPQYKSYSLTGNTASQLSQSVRERLMMGSQSLPKAAVSGHATHEYGLVMRQSRPKASDGSLSDTQAIENTSPYAPWLRHSNTYSIAPRLAETDSMESLSSLPGHRGSLTHSRLLRDSSARLSRSNSIRSTKSEKLYPSMLHRGPESEPEPYYCLPVGAIGVNPHGAGGIVAQHWSQPTSPAPAGSGSPRLFPLSPTHGTLRHGLPKNDDVHGSSVSLVSTASSIYSSAEEKQAHEIRKLRRELVDAQEKVHTLTSQLSTNAHVVSAFEQSLSSMTQRLQYLTATAEKKDSELAELRQAMESLRAQSVQAGLTSGLARQPSSDSVSSLSSACSLDKQDKKKKKGWLRSSFTKAFSRNAKQTKIQSMSEGETGTEHRPSMESKSSQIHADGSVEVEELQKQLREKDLVLTDIRLEALSSAHQLESLKDTVMKMRNEMLSLKQNNERLQRMVAGTISQDDEHDSISEPPPDVIAIDDTSIEPEPDGKKISISVYLGRPQTFEKYYMEHFGPDGGQNAPEGREIVIAFRNVGASTSWGQLDSAVRRSFEKHVTRLDPNGALGLGGDSIAKYRLGEAERAPDAPPPDLLPVGYAIGRVSTLHIVLRPVCALAFEALIPRGVAQRLVSLLSEHGRLVLCGPPGTGKTHLAQRLADFHAQSQGRDPGDAVATFNVDHKSVKELRQYLTHLGDRASAGDSSVLPCVVVLDNLHRAGPLSEALGTLPRALPCLIGTMAQAACSATSLQLQHGFRWVLVAPHMEPASGLLGRVLRRRLATLELIHGDRPELAAVVGWLPRVWRHLNKFLETHSSSDVAIGPRLFLACPLDLDAAKAWFSDVWNYSLAPYLREAAREGLQLYGKRAAWVDPCQFVFETYPWPGTPPQNLVRIGPEDVGLEAGSTTQSDRDADPLLNMLMRLQEAANYSSPHSNDSDCASLDSNLTHESSLGTESVL